ncbi:PREDICTED: aquaporin NIP1-1-like [Camelina sativa]|uniref:Aquaporin NIP1-1-like n=1 Tax=Camelina sativa TaxID=90675 RepID=A0ABM0UDZ3_CAMSA|nr:PREDICTED: aquaporin NIP1-1-like [Camelina sativa]
MGDISGNGYGAREEAVVVNLKEEDEHQQQQIEATRLNPNPLKKQNSLLSVSVPFLQKLMAEFVGTYFLVFTGCASVAVNIQNDNALTLPGIAIVWGLTVMVLIYSLGHISGAHFNPAITIAFASCRRFPLKQVPAYVISQVVGATLAAATLRLLLGLDHDVCSGKHDVFIGSSPVGSDLQAFVMEFIVTFYLMFITSGVATDNRAIGELAGLAIGATILLNVLIAAPISSASMNPARSFGPAMVHGCYKGIWIYIVSPILGAVSGAWVYNTVRYTDKPLREITKSGSFLKTVRSGSS